MKNIISISLLLILPFMVSAQGKKTKKMLKEIQNEWKMDKKGKITYTKIVEIPGLTKDEIYNRALSYFVDNQMNQLNVQTQNKELGSILVKGTYKEIHENMRRTTFSVIVDCLYSVKIDIKEGKARSSVTLVGFNILDSINENRWYKVKVEDSFPVNPIADSKNITGKAFYKSHMAAQTTLNDIETALKNKKEGNTDKEDDW